MGKTILGRIVQRLVMLSVLVACLGVIASTPASQAAAMACPYNQWYECEMVNGGYFNEFHCTCSLPEDIYNCEQAGGTWDYHMARCRF
jgi:hypothetical protein